MYLDYSSYFQRLISNTENIISNQDSILIGLSIIIFTIILYFIYIFIRNMIKGG